MSARTLNRVEIIGNLVKKPELKVTTRGTHCAVFHVITHREWTSDGERKKTSTRHVCVAWDKLAELCHQLLEKGTKVYVEGRLESREFVDANGINKEHTEIVLNEMIVLEKPKYEGSDVDSFVGSENQHGKTSNYPARTE